MMEKELDTWGRHLLNRTRNSKKEEFMNMNMFLNGLVKRVTLKNEDAVCAVTGDRGKGKSTFSLGGSMQLGQLIKRDKGGKAFVWENISYRYEDIDKIIEKAGDDDQMVYDIDEGLDVANAKDAMTRVNKEISKFMQKARKKRNIYFWNIPDFLELDSTIRNRVIHFWIHVFWKSSDLDRHKRYGLAALMRRNQNPYKRDKWGLDEKGDMSKPMIHSVEDLRAHLHRSPGFVADLAFSILPETIEEAYLKESNEALRLSSKSFKLSRVPVKTTPDVGTPSQ